MECEDYGGTRFTNIRAYITEFHRSLRTHAVIEETRTLKPQVDPDYSAVKRSRHLLK